MAINNIEEIENIEDVETNLEDPETPTTTPKGCIAQVGQEAKKVTVQKIGDCCKDIIASAPDISIYMKEIKASIIKGKVLCGSKAGGTGIEGTIVVATTGTGVGIKHYVGVTNSTGHYSICVPTSSSGPIDYFVEAYCCGSCVSDVCSDADCKCGCVDKS